MEVSVNCNQEIILNRSLLRAIVRNNVKDIIHLISLGADVNFECTIEQLLLLNILDDNAIAILKNAEVTTDKLIRDGYVGGVPKCNVPDIFIRKLLENKPDAKWLSIGNENKKEFHISRDELTSIEGNRYSTLMILPFISGKIILSPKSKLSPVQLAIMRGFREATIGLIKKGANPNSVLDVQNMTVLQLMCTAAVLKDKRLYAFDEDVIQLLFDHGADPNIQDVNGQTFLHFATYYSEFQLERIVLKSDSKDVHDHREIKKIEKFLMNGANPNIKDVNHSETVLSLIVQSDLTNLFLDHGSTYYTDDYMHKDPSRRKYIEKFNLEHRHHVKQNNSLIEAIKIKDESNVGILLSKGVSPNIRDKDGLSALHIAVKNGDYNITKLLLRRGANPNIKSWKNGTTPIFNAVIDNNVVLVDLLVEFKANLNVTNTKRISPLYFPVTNNNENMTKFLLVHNANPNISRYFFILFGMLNEVSYKGHMKMIENILNKIYNISMFLKSRDIPIFYHLFYNSMDNAEINNRHYVAKKIRELIDKLL